MTHPMVTMFTTHSGCEPVVAAGCADEAASVGVEEVVEVASLVVLLLLQS